MTVMSRLPAPAHNGVLVALMVSIFVLVSFKPGLFLSGENLIRYVVTPGKPRKLVGDFPASLKYYGFGSWQCGRVSVRGSRSILQGFLIVGSNFLSSGTPHNNLDIG